MGQLTASIAHEVSQPIATAVTSAYAALRWLSRHPPDLEKVRQSLDAIIKDGNRAGGVIGRIRALIQKVPPRHDQLDINDTILEVIEVTRSELLRNDVRTRKGLAAHSRRSHPTATDSPKLDHERRRSDERRQQGVARFAD
jgi:C4-dicarboxylate-specific signal transduction histidine kinase